MHWTVHNPSQIVVTSQTGGGRSSSSQHPESNRGKNKWHIKVYGFVCTSRWHRCQARGQATQTHRAKITSRQLYVSEWTHNIVGHGDGVEGGWMISFRFSFMCKELFVWKQNNWSLSTGKHNNIQLGENKLLSDQIIRKCLHNHKTIAIYCIHDYRTGSVHEHFYIQIFFVFVRFSFRPISQLYCTSIYGVLCSSSCFWFSIN